MMAILAFGAGVIVGAAAAATYWATQYWEVCREVVGHRQDAADLVRSNHTLRVELRDQKAGAAALTTENNRLKELLDQTQKMLMVRNRVIDGVRDSLATEGCDECEY